MERSSVGRRSVDAAHAAEKANHVPSRKEAAPGQSNVFLISGSPHILLSLAFVCMLLPSPTIINGDGDDTSLPSKITHVVNDPGQVVRPPMRAPSLRGCCGAPTEFQWVFLDGEGTSAGSPFRTRVFALDAQGRQARPAACGELRVDVELSGQARLSPSTPLKGWNNAELRLDIENHLAEVIDAEVRIESPNSNADVLLHSSQIRFASGPAYTFFIRVQHPGTYLDATAQGEQKDTVFPTNANLEVFVVTHDRFGNLAKLAGGDAGNKNLDLAGLGNNLVLQSSSRSLEFVPKDGRLHLNSRTGEGRTTLRSGEAGMVDVWLDSTDKHATRESKEALRGRSLRRLQFIDPAADDSKTEGSAGKKTLEPSDEKYQHVAEEVKNAFLTTWRTYRKYAWGRDELMPISKTGKDSFGGLGITILDSLTTLWLMGLTVEFEQAAAFVEGVLDFDNADEEISVFELIIRGLGGLLGAHSLSGRPIFLTKATELAERLLPALNSSSNLPWPKWSLKRGVGSVSTEPTILAEAGSMQLELRYLSARTGDNRFKRAGDLCFDAIQSTGVTGLAPVYLTPPGHTPPRALSSKYAIGALADSYYEYLLKQYIQNPSEAYFKDLWLNALDEVPGLIRPRPGGEKKRAEKEKDRPPKFKLIEVAPGGEAIWKMDHLSCFAPAMIVLGLKTLPEKDLLEKGRNATWWRIAEGLTDSCMELWTSSRSGLAPEFAMIRPSAPFNFHEVPEKGRHSFLRPETAESLFYLYRFTGNEKYRKAGEKIFRAMMKHSKVEAGFASVKDVNQIPTVKLDEMQSFVMAETFKYLYLLFSPAETLDLDRFVLNTEGHPLRLAKR